MSSPAWPTPSETGFSGSPDTRRPDLSPGRPVRGTSHVLVITCEHGGNSIPRAFAALFRGQTALLSSHRGWDPGALFLARSMARTLGAPLFFSTTSRLLVDLNRSPNHPRVFSPITRPLPAAARREIMARWYHPYRRRVEEAIRMNGQSGQRVVHLSVHSFTPILDGRPRQVEVGLLYDPSRGLEREFSRTMARALRESVLGRIDPLRIRFNQPYRGISDGFTTHLRRQFSPDAYVGIELEVNQRLVARDGEEKELIREALLWAVKTGVLH